jgi:outer membrane biosynthesis protein TonB
MPRRAGRQPRTSLSLLALAAALACTANPGEPASSGPADPKPQTPPDNDTAPPARALPGEPWPESSAPSSDPQAPPLSLTASDGTGLRLVSLTSRGVIDAPLAFTELRLIFENPEDREIEGRFEIDMPPGAAISRFAMKIDGNWQEGEVVERQAARVAYEDFLHRRQDPALLENDAGNAFSARVFPIRPRERKELIVSYSQELAASREPYRVMLRGLPELAELDATVVVREPDLGGTGVRARVFQVAKSHYKPDRDLEVTVDRPGALGLRHGRLAVARVAPVGDMPPAPIGSLVVLFDTSASRTLGFDRQLQLLKDVLTDLRQQSGEDFRVRVVAFDQSPEEIFAGPASGFGDRQIERLRARRALGASSLAAALRSVAMDPRGATRLLLVSDGIATAGQQDLAVVYDIGRVLSAAGLVRADAIVEGGIQDTSTLKAITTAGFMHDGVVIDGRAAPATIARKLAAATLRPLKVEIPGAAWTWPEVIEGVQPGDETLVYADIPPEQAMTVVLTGEQRIEVPVTATQTERPLLERAWMRAQIERLQAERSALPPDDIKGRDSLKETIIGLSTRYRVLSEFTALLVLETDADYRRFGIDRTALADILTAGATGVALIGRAKPPDPDAVESTRTEHFMKVLPSAADGDELLADPPAIAPQGPPPEQPAEPEPAPAREKMERPAPDKGAPAEVAADKDVWGGLGAEADSKRAPDDGGTGYGRGAAAGFGGRGRAVSTVEIGVPLSDDNYDLTLLRRIVRAHVNEVRHCYNQGLARDPQARGRLLIHVAIAPTGKPANVVVQESTLKDPQIGQCVLAAVRRWTFVKPTQDIVARLPFTLEPSGGEDDDEEDEDEDEDEIERIEPYTGKFLEIHQHLRKRDHKSALRDALAWLESSPGDVLALIAVGDAAEAAGDKQLALRAYGSLIDLFPARADLRRYAGNRLEALGDLGLPLAIDTYTKAADSRPDHPSSHRLLAFALVKAGLYREAADALIRGMDQKYPDDRFDGHDRIFTEDLGIVAAAWLRAQPKDIGAVRARLEGRSMMAAGPSTSFVITWETDANDVDFHIRDGKRGHAYFDDMELPSGGELFADITDGYGPECFMIPGKPTAYPYTFEAHY